MGEKEALLKLQSLTLAHPMTTCNDLEPLECPLPAGKKALTLS